MTIPSIVYADSTSCMAKAIYFESRGGSDKDQLAVGHTVQNRVKSGKFPNSVCGVVNQKGQFASGIRSNRRIDEPAAWNTAKVLANKVLSGSSRDFTKGATYFHNSTVRPSWSRKFKNVYRNAQHIFYKP